MPNIEATEGQVVDIETDGKKLVRVVVVRSRGGRLHAVAQPGGSDESVRSAGARLKKVLDESAADRDNSGHEHLSEPNPKVRHRKISR